MDLCKDCDMAMQVESICEICKNADKYRKQAEQLQAELDKQKKIIEEMLQAMKNYEMDVSDEDFPPPYKHKEMMKRAEQALKGGK